MVGSSKNKTILKDKNGYPLLKNLLNLKI